MDHIEIQLSAILHNSNRVDFRKSVYCGPLGFGSTQDAFLVTIVINILTSILQALYSLNHWGRHKLHTDERGRETNHLILYYNIDAPENSS